MNDMFIPLIFLIAALFLTADIIRRSADIFLMSSRAKEQKNAYRRLTKVKQPHVTVLVYGDEKSEKTNETMRAVARSNYAVYDVVNANHRLAETNAHRAAYRRSKRGEIIVCLRAGEVPDSFFLKRVVLARKGQERWWVAIEKPSYASGVMGITEKIQKALWGNTVSIEACTAKALRRIDPMMHRFKGVPYIMAGFITFGVIFISMYGGGIALWYAWLSFSLYLVAVLLLQENVLAKDRWQALFAAPSAFFLVSIASLFEGIFQLRARK